MDDTSFVGWLDWAKYWASVLVVVFLAVEVAADRISAPAAKRIEKEREDAVTAANTAAAQANERAAGLEKEAALLRLQLDQEVQKRAPRTLSDEQKKILLQELNGKIPSVLFFVQNDLEAQAFALQLQVIFQEAGAQIRYREAAIDQKAYFPGGVLMHSPKGADLAGDPLYEALSKAGLYGGNAPRPNDFLSLRASEAPFFGPDGYIVYVGQKSPF